MVSQVDVPHREDFASWCPVATGTNASWRVKVPHRVTDLTIQRFDSRRRLVHQDHRSGMLTEPLRGPHLIVPCESVLRIGREFDIVRWVGIYEIRFAEFEN